MTLKPPHPHPGRARPVYFLLPHLPISQQLCLPLRYVHQLCSELICWEVGSQGKAGPTAAKAVSHWHRRSRWWWYGQTIPGFTSSASRNLYQTNTRGVWAAHWLTGWLADWWEQTQPSQTSIPGPPVAEAKAECREATSGWRTSPQ